MCSVIKLIFQQENHAKDFIQGENENYLGCKVWKTDHTQHNIQTGLLIKFNFGNMYLEILPVPMG
jgi:hypothetical protein